MGVVDERAAMYRHCLYEGLSPEQEELMIVQFAKWGNSLALRIPSGFARQISAHPGCQAEARIVRGRLIIEPIKETEEYDLETLLADMTPDHLHGETSTGSAVGGEFA